MGTIFPSFLFTKKAIFLQSSISKGYSKIYCQKICLPPHVIDHGLCSSNIIPIDQSGLKKDHV